MVDYSPYIEKIKMETTGYVAHNGYSSLGPFITIAELFEAIKRAGWERDFIREKPASNTMKTTV